MKDQPFNDLLLGKESFFWTPDYVATSAWIEHIPFAFWMVEAAKPKVLVELGVHNGTSYFSFCQAVKNLNLDAACYGVDTWQGDEHTGFYDDAVFAKVTEHNQAQYAGFSTLIRSTFDEAAAYFIDGTVDLLHIDGLHTYEAVKHDFETWLPKLSSNAFVLFHDINVRERNFGVFKFWEEVQQQYPTFQFHFGYGLGVLCIGNPAGQAFNLLFNATADKSFATFLRSLFSDRGHAIKAKFMLEQAVLAAKEENNTQAFALTQLQHTYKTLQEAHTQLQAGFEALRDSYEQVKDHVNSLEELKVKVEEHHKLLLEAGHKEDLILASTSSLPDTLKNLMLKNEEHSRLVAEKKALLEELAWYKRTYEKRSILGLIKSRLTK